MGRTVVLADDAFIVREGVRMVLRRAHRPVLAVTDIRMTPSRTGEGIRAAVRVKAYVSRHDSMRMFLNQGAVIYGVAAVVIGLIFANVGGAAAGRTLT